MRVECIHARLIDCWRLGGRFCRESFGRWTVLGLWFGVESVAGGVDEGEKTMCLEAEGEGRCLWFLAHLAMDLGEMYSADDVSSYEYESMRAF